MDSDFNNQSGDFFSDRGRCLLPFVHLDCPECYLIKCPVTGTAGGSLEAERWWNLSGRSLRTCLTPPEHTLSRPSAHKSTLKQTEETKPTRP